MLRITTCQNAEAARQYYTSLANGDYYAQDHSVQGTWGGKGATRLGLAGHVQRDEFFRLADNLHPHTGERLTSRNQPNRRAAFDLTFSAHKSVSLVYALTGDERIREAFEQSVEETMSELEKDAQVRVRRGQQKNHRENRTTGNLVWARFTHKESRPIGGIPDPQLHCHSVVLNASYDQEERKWKAVDLGLIHRDANY